ncbi:MAG: hypothetical protein LAN64_03080 [Acidobacteriia bacterium]|nr:hypothetical protein [Terriglobia bacterium]
MVSKATKAVFSGMLLLGILGLGIDGVDTRQSLTITDRRVIEKLQSSSGFAIAQPIKCSPDGTTMFVRFIRRSPARSVTAIGVSGRNTSEFVVSSATDVPGASMVDFAPYGSGAALLLERQEKKTSPVETYVAIFDKDGQYKSAWKLTFEGLENARARQIAAFHTGDVLISGFDRQDLVPFAAVFDSRGRFLKRVALEGDTRFLANQHLADKKLYEAARGFLGALATAQLQSGDDGNVYLLRHSPTGLLYVIDPSGNARRVLLRAPEHGNLISAKVSHGTIAVEYGLNMDSASSSTTTVFVINDTLTGEKIAEYGRGKERLAARGVSS